MKVCLFVCWFINSDACLFLFRNHQLDVIVEIGARTFECGKRLDQAYGRIMFNDEMSHSDLVRSLYSFAQRKFIETFAKIATRRTMDRKSRRRYRRIAKNYRRIQSI